jgi:hypothetical protein
MAKKVAVTIKTDRSRRQFYCRWWTPTWRAAASTKGKKTSCVNLDEPLQMLIRKVLILPGQHWRHEPLTPCSDIHASYTPHPVFIILMTQSLPDPISNAQKCWSPPTRPCCVISQKTIQIKLMEFVCTQDPVYETDSTRDLMLASEAAQMVSTFTHSLQHIQILSTSDGCFHY